MTARLRLPLVDALKAIAAQLIVLHHLCLYGPMPDIALALAPAVILAFAEHGRLAVQLFLVVGGFLAARSIATEGHLRSAHPGELILQRYVRLAVPVPAVIALAVAAAAAARTLMQHPMTPAPASLAQLVAHLLLAQDLLGFESLSAGLWYLAIDFQLFALLVGVLWLGRALSTRRGERLRHPGALLVLLLAAVALLGVNRQPQWDNLGLYFFGSYALGAFAWWSAFNRHRRLRALFVVLVAMTLLALLIDLRSRIALALLLAILLRTLGRHGHLARWGHSALLAWQARISYAVFLVHFPVLLLTNALFAKLAPQQPGYAIAGMLLAWLSCNLAGQGFHRYVEAPASRFAGRLLARLAAR